jgi:hypothetical protein
MKYFILLIIIIPLYSNDYQIKLKETKLFSQNPVQYILTHIIEKDKKYYKDVLIKKNNNIFRTLLKDRFTPQEIEGLANLNNMFSLISIMSFSIDNQTNKNSILYNEVLFFENLEKAVYYDLDNYLGSYIKISEQKDGYMAVDLGFSFRRLINGRPITFLNTIKKYNLSYEKLCKLFETDIGDPILTKHTKQIYQDNFDKNDKTIKQILKCEKDFYEEYNK